MDSLLTNGQTHADTFQLFDVSGICSNEKWTQTGMREDMVLLSWLIVLLRTSESGQVEYDWAYKYQDGREPETMFRRLSTSEVIPGFQSTVAQVTAGISNHIKATGPGQGTFTPSPVTLLLSSSSLSRACVDTKDKVITINPNCLQGVNKQTQDVLHLEIQLDNGLLAIHPVWHSANMLPYTISHHIEVLVDTLRVCLSNSAMSIDDCLRPTTQDLNDIWSWNHLVPPLYNFCMHEVISKRAHQHPNKVAISSWDGDLTYGQVEQYSTSVACALKDMAVELHDIVPVCFEKSRWTIVAVLAVMKAGATFVLMDPTLPVARLQNMAQQVGAKAILASRQQYDLSTCIIPSGHQVVVDAETVTSSWHVNTLPTLAPVPSSALMYIIFTSGSTGTPKGVKISHETYTSSALPRSKAVGYTDESRVLDFASYAFDVSIDSMLLTLGNGGCLCIPSDEDRLNDINAVIRRMQVNYAGLTPSVARILDQDVIASLSGLGLGGEAVSATDVNHWGQDVRIIIGYGPCECTIGCTINSSAAKGRNYISIGSGNGAAIWIVNPDDHESLVAIGAVGELLVEGPIVGQGYLNDPEKTAAAFIQDPPWLTAGHGRYPGRQGRLYKTGDLGRYDPDGSGGIVFAGRKDAQVKLRGQRVELGEIESQLMNGLPSEIGVIAEVIVPQGSSSQATLVTFLAPQATKGQEQNELILTEVPDELVNALSKSSVSLAEVLPRYMLPTAYIPINFIPVLISGKIDRKRLKEFGATVDLRKLDHTKSNIAPQQLSGREQQLRSTWSQVLKLDEFSIQPTDNFFALGGDSLSAMKLVTVCREHGLDVTVANIFGQPTLSAMASVVGICRSQAQIETPAFAMLSQSAENACLEASRICEASPADIEDIYPCTPTQESLFTFSIKSTKAYIAQRVSCIPPHISTEAWKEAWEEVAAANPILRTRLAQLKEPSLQQVVLKGRISWAHWTDLEQYLENDRNLQMNLGQNLARYAIVSHPDGKRFMVWTVHHVLYDGWSEPLILQEVSRALQNCELQIPTTIRDFVKYVRETDATAMQKFWQDELKGAIGPQFPRLPSRDYLPTPDALLQHFVPLELSAASSFTAATVIRGAWALVASQYTGSDDVVFGETLTGRDIPLPGVENIIGPLIATLPVRVQVDRVGSTESYLRAIQQSMLARTPYQHMGMQNIRKVSQDAQHACETGTGLVIQPEPEYICGELGFDQGDVVREALNFNPYPLMLAFGIQKGGFRVCASFDSDLIEVEQMKRILKQLEVTCLELTKSLDRRIGEISCIPREELDQIWQWNKIPPLSLDESSRRLQADPNTKQGSIYPRAVIPWVCNPRNTSLLSPIGSVGELWLEGNCFSGEFIESPAWLVAGGSECRGRTGRLQPTGDMVRLLGDGSMVFVGRRDNVFLVQGHPVDTTEVEAHCKKYLPSTNRAAAAIFQPSSSSAKEVLQRDMIVFIEHRPSGEDNIQIMPTNHHIVCDDSVQASLDTTICAAIPIGLASALKKLNKFMQDSFPAYMTPYAYVVVDKIPAGKQTDRGLLNRLASWIPQQILAQFRDGLKNAWSKVSLQPDLSIPEKILQSSWAEILGIDSDQIDVEDNFFRLGGDSVLAMKLVSRLRAQGHGLTVADIFRHMRLGDAARVLKVEKRSKETVRSYQPFSMLGQLDLDLFLSENIKPNLDDPRWSVRDVLPVTDTQALDIMQTINVPRTSIQYTMLYFGTDIDRERLTRACKDLIRTHDILRTVFVEHTPTFFQVVLDDLTTIPMTMHQTDESLEEYIEHLCAVHIESGFHLGSHFFNMFLVEGRDGQGCLVIGLSHALYDGVSLPRLLRDLEAMYAGTEVAEFEPFSSYMAEISNKHLEAEALRYWRNLLNGSSLSILNGSSVKLHAPAKAIFKTKPTGIFHPVEEITIANILSASWALVLARRLKKPDVTFGSVTSGRNIDLANVENVVGPCYQITPIRVLFQPGWTAMDLLRFVQSQNAESAAHDFVGFSKIAKQCTQWSSEAQFLDSMVHHQDFEDFDTMPFAGRTCRVEVLKPHGDAAYPLKVVSFAQRGEMHVGVVGDERDPVFVDTVVNELAATVQELANRRWERVLGVGDSAA